VSVKQRYGAHPNEERRTLILTGASRGIGHATVKRFSSAGWRVISCSRHPFPEDCPWEAGPEDHIQVDLVDPDNTIRAIAEMKDRLRAQGGRRSSTMRRSRPRGRGAAG
jgi:NAD(P)-dependent dehydrogenase (short-subunit alcohol dehydrogenase family)